MRKSESLEKLSIVLMGLSIGVLFGGLAMKYLPIIIVGFAPIVIIIVAFLIREISERIEKCAKILNSGEAQSMKTISDVIIHLRDNVIPDVTGETQERVFDAIYALKIIQYD